MGCSISADAEPLFRSAQWSDEFEYNRDYVETIIVKNVSVRCMQSQQDNDPAQDYFDMIIIHVLINSHILSLVFANPTAGIICWQITQLSRT